MASGSGFDLYAEASLFAAELSDLLNKTICDGVRLSAVLQKELGVVTVGYGISRRQWDVRRGIPLSCDGKAPSAHLVIAYTLRPDRASRFLAVASSVFALTLDAELSQELFHIDFERDKSDGYPEAHLQIAASSPHWAEWCSRVSDKGRDLGRLHFPVGGRRFRPSLEDLIDFLVTEGLVEARPGWTEHVERGRERFHERQLRAAIRRNPEIARDILAMIDAGEA